MPPDIELHELTAGGLLEPHADWTAAAEANVIEALRAESKDRQDEIVVYQAPSGDASKLRRHQQVMKLHDAVGGAILFHQLGPPLFQLPTKQADFDMSLGRDVNTLREDFGADYGLFIFLRDSYASGGRIAITVLAAVAGIGMPGAIQTGFASLVDLRTGNIVWFDHLVSERGDLRNPEDARESIRTLLEGFPL